MIYNAHHTPYGGLPKLEPIFGIEADSEQEAIRLVRLVWPYVAFDLDPIEESEDDDD